MADVPKSSPNNILSDTPDIKKITEMSRETLAKKLWIRVKDLPDRKFFKVVNEQLDKLEHLDPTEKSKALQETLSKIRADEVANKALELWKDWIKWAQDLWQKGADVVKKLTPEGMTDRISETAKTLKKDIGKWGTEVLWAVWDIVNSGSYIFESDNPKESYKNLLKSFE